jgi:hypothetical protein
MPWVLETNIRGPEGPEGPEGPSTPSADAGNVLGKGLDNLLYWDGDYNDLINVPPPGSDSPWKQNGDDIYYNAGNVGIGNTAPRSILHIGKGSEALAEFTISSGAAIGERQRITFDGGANERGFIECEIVPGAYGVLKFGTGLEGLMLGERMRIDANGNVGIGTTNPTHMLTVNGNLTAAGTAEVTSSLYVSQTLGAGAADRVRIHHNGTDTYFDCGGQIRFRDGAVITEWLRLDTAGRMYLNGKETLESRDSWLRINENGDYTSGVLFATGKVCIANTLAAGTFAPDTAYKLYIAGNSYFSGDITKVGSSGNFSVNSEGVLDAWEVVAGRGSGSVALTINDGYGNANLTFNHVNGVPDSTGAAARIEVSTDSANGGSFSFEAMNSVTAGVATTLNSICFMNSAGGTGGNNTKILIFGDCEVDGSVLINTTTQLPGSTNAQLVVNGQLALGKTGNEGGEMFFVNAEGTALAWRVDVPSVNSFRIMNGSSVGVKLDQGAQTWSAQSDVRLKDVTSDIDNALDAVDSLSAVRYRFKSGDGIDRVGLLAHEVQKVLPEVVSEDDNGMLSIRYTEVIPLLVAAIKELKTRLH